MVREAGRPDRCAQSTEQAPDPECRSPIQVFLQPLPAGVSDRGPPGTVEVACHAAEGERTWQVEVGERPVCATPCDRWVDPTIPYAMRLDPGLLHRDQVVEQVRFRRIGATGDACATRRIARVSVSSQARR